jgi:hypothetical protein
MRPMNVIVHGNNIHILLYNSNHAFLSCTPGVSIPCSSPNGSSLSSSSTGCLPLHQFVHMEQYLAFSLGSFVGLGGLAGGDSTGRGGLTGGDSTTLICGEEILVARSRSARSSVLLRFDPPVDMRFCGFTLDSLSESETLNASESES